jgi:hypothetical protein
MELRSRVISGHIRWGWQSVCKHSPGLGAKIPNLLSFFNQGPYFRCNGTAVGARAAGRSTRSSQVAAIMPPPAQGRVVVAIMP